MEYGVAIARFLLGVATLPLVVPGVKFLYLVIGIITGAYLFFAMAVAEDLGP